MAYHSDLSDNFGRMGLGDGRRDEAYSSHRDYYPPPQPYGSGHDAQSRDAYSSPPPVPGYGTRPPPVYSPPADKQPIPSGWTPHWDETHQHWYYFEESTGHSQWEAPGYSAEQGSRGYDSGHGGYGAPVSEGYGHEGYGQGGYSNPPEEKKKGHGGALMGAAAGLAVGAVGGALLANAFDDSDDEHRAAPAVYESAPPGVIPAYDAYGDPISESDRESLQEAREDYEEALADAASSSASSSEREELEEAREEYEEEYEEAYYDD